jgi:hypothetical protein
MKTVWLSAIGTQEQEVQALLKKMKTYGLVVSGSRWVDDNKAMAFMGSREEMIKPQCALWVAMGSKNAFQNADTRYGLSLLSLSVQAQRESVLPMVVLQTDSEPLSPVDLPTPLQRAVVLPAADAGTPAKLVARLHANSPALQTAYYFDMVGNPQFGQWFEVRPVRDEWPGMIFGVEEAQIKFQAVGPAGQLPKNSTLNYPMQGLRIQYGGRSYSAWAVRNRITPESSYYIKVEGAPNSVLFGAFSEQNETDMYRVDLK